MRTLFRGAVDDIAAERGMTAPDADFSVEPPRDARHGEVSSNAALVFASTLGMKPRDLADRLVARLEEKQEMLEISVAGPGFVNLVLERDIWRERLREILAAGISWGDSDFGAGRRVNVEYVSVNPTGPMHVGHGRGAVVGDALAALLAKAGFAVTREYYVNDAGVQVDLLARSLYHRYREAAGDAPGAMGEDFYPGDYLAETGEALLAEDGTRWLGAAEEHWLPPVRDFAIEAMMALIRDDLAALGVEHDVFASERELAASGAVERTLLELEGRGLLHVGVLEPPKGKADEDWEARPQTLFRSTAFGDDSDRAIRKSDGSWTYFATDMAYHRDKFERGFPVLIDVWGADHKGYVKRMEAAVEALSAGEARFSVLICNLVNLSEAGRPVKMSKRAGTYVTLREVVDRVGKDVVRFIMLTRGNEAPLDFDLARAVEQSRDNPVFYVQYAHARACSALRNAAEAFPGEDFSDDALGRATLDLLEGEEELALIRKLAGWPRIVEAAAEAAEPHRIAYALSDIAAAFHGLWNLGNVDDSRRFVVAGDPALSRARLALVRATALVVASGLDIMGVAPVEEMR
ncbi:MAG: arginine--tRNA ligase [Defluviicoccus sp.]|nr:arginine--tRNA ligase [Defluviicoccus sp.]MDE0383492.1 arginine--tRNA ligase [Defluviicoccus sp.]